VNALVTGLRVSVTRANLSAVLLLAEEFWLEKLLSECSALQLASARDLILHPISIANVCQYYDGRFVKNKALFVKNKALLSFLEESNFDKMKTRGYTINWGIGDAVSQICLQDDKNVSRVRVICHSSRHEAVISWYTSWIEVMPSTITSIKSMVRRLKVWRSTPL
jgi:hypothetical protein